MDTTKKLISGIDQIPDLYILGKPDMSVFSFTSDTLDVYHLAASMETKGWHLDRLQFPYALHMMVNPHHAKIVEPFLNDLKQSVEDVLKNPQNKPEGASAIYGMVI